MTVTIIEAPENHVSRTIDSAIQFNHALPLECTEELFFGLLGVLAYAEESHPNITIEQLFEKDPMVHALVRAYRGRTSH